MTRRRAAMRGDSVQLLTPSRLKAFVICFRCDGAGLHKWFCEGFAAPHREFRHLGDLELTAAVA